jgi:hypothetical protein
MDCIETLLKHGADPNEITQVNGHPPLVYARSAAAAELLLQYGASIIDPSSAKRELLGPTIERGDADVVAMLRRHIDLQADNKSSLNQ